ncbi:hypothetical protein QBZ16_001657 [Prototheca wickerhamii]|uniref:CCHC-type domain-containing protein n=1 Tax=Prototheca wickerhamii TaxID=3111 RepID=A0AAD9IEG5_PROWI|nr:hypothetical protein QBZ16_001657 [Prototheca wickerhamii]
MPQVLQPGPRASGGGPRCFKCGLAGHLARDCPNPSAAKPCHVCASLEHTPWDCPRALCFKCRQPGHKARDCPGFVPRRGPRPGRGMLPLRPRRLPGAPTTRPTPARAAAAGTTTCWTTSETRAAPRAAGAGTSAARRRP